MPLKGFQAIALAGAVLAGGCMAQPAVVPAATTLLTGGSGLAPGDDIDGLDVAIDAGGDVYVVWRERSNVYQGDRPDERLVYRAGSGMPLHWGPRTVIAQGGMGSQRARVVAMPDGIHVIAGQRLRHWWLPAGGGPARDLGNLLGDTGPGADGFDVAADGHDLLVVFASPDGLRDQALRAVHWTGGGTQPPVLVAAFKDTRRGAPVLLGSGRHRVAFWANNALAESYDAKIRMTVTRLEPDVRTASSDDGGRSWSPPRRAMASATEVNGLDAVGIGDDIALFVASDGLYRSRAQAGGWSAPVRIAAYEPGVLSGGRETSAVAAGRCNGHDVVAWVDARHRRSDRRAWNPLGGFPWGDNPDWANNDVFVAVRLPQAADAASALAPRRLTAAGSMTRDVAMVERNGALLVFRSGRAQVRKAPNDAGAAPEVTVSRVDCD